ncbi:MAG: hypothetical protein QOD42_3271 [Sphingomonadales bacterium]|jgi:hypothetical protein|nr:hypothetical protein [Sphingomonadales bacterium]
MRIAAWVLVAIAAAATFWFGAVAAMLILPPSDGNPMQDHYYAIASARYGFPVALFALVNAAAALCLAGRPRSRALWAVLAGALLALALLGWEYWWQAPETSRRVPDYADAFERVFWWRLAVGRLLFWGAIAGTALGWIAWLAARLRGRGAVE